MRRFLLVALLILPSAAVGAETDRDCRQCPEMVQLPQGEFMMGSAPGEEEREGVPAASRGVSEPQVRVRINYPLAIGRYEVTRGEFAAFVRATNHVTAPGCQTLGFDGRSVERPGLSWRNPGFAQTDRDPVVCVSWDDARQYAEWLQRTTKKTYRLPTEAEWEYAARAGSAQARYWGDGREGTCRNANVADQTAAITLNWQVSPQAVFGCNDGYAFTAPVGKFLPNAFGLHDMLGNAWEWAGDCWNGSHARATGNSDYRRDGDCARRVVRGGGWSNPPRNIRAASRSAQAIGDRNNLMGFRVARAN
ncbi:MAG TPA: formylglycine-generating enzyme family protein [Vineibacter sp.]|nr:formylglycine-generating enzyme family protein [Vineibacter sp.]